MHPDLHPTEQPHPFALPATTHSYLARAADSLSEAIATTDVAQRYAGAHVAALRAAAALLSARARPEPVRGRRRQNNAWVLLGEVAPELAEWARFFAAGAAKRAAAEAGSSRAVSEREADDLVRDADRFLAVVEESLGLMVHAPMASSLRPAARASSLRPTATRPGSLRAAATAASTSVTDRRAG